MEIFGGEDENSNPINDSWVLDFGVRDHLSVPVDENDVICSKFNRKQPNRVPRLGTPCLNFGINQVSSLYIGKTFRHYLYIDRLDHGNTL